MPKQSRSKDPLYSEGARVERKAMRAKLRRRRAQAQRNGHGLDTVVLDELLDWVLTRQKRYEDAAGGL